MKNLFPLARRLCQRRGWPLLVLALGLLWGSTAVVHAHANLVRAEPAPNSVLATPPEQVSVWFTETLAPQFGDIQVLGARGERVDSGVSGVDPQDPTRLTVALPPLANGTYTVLWSNVSTVDGHRVRGSFRFSIGEPTAATVPTQAVSGPLLQSPLAPLWRWLALLSVMALVGGLGFHQYIAQPVLAQERRHPSGSEAVRRWQQHSRQLIWLAGALFAVASMAQLITQTVVTYDLPALAVLDRPLFDFLLGTGWGSLWLWRMGLLILLLAALAAGRHLPAFLREAAPLVVGAALLLTLSLVSHAAATEAVRLPAVFNDYLHLLAATVWVGGLIHLAPGIVLLRRDLSGEPQRAMLKALVARFSRLGLLAVIVLGLTGLYSAWAQVTVVAALVTPYGRFLLLKMGLVAALLMLAALNLFWVRPRLARDERGGRYLARLVSAEVALALLVLLATGLLTALEPARQVASRLGIGQATSSHYSETVSAMKLDVTVTPAHTGANRALITVTDLDGRPIDDADDVSLQLAYLETDLGNSVIPAKPLGDGQYEVNNLPLSLDGLWQIIVAVRRIEARDARTAFRLDVAAPPLDNSAAIGPTTRLGQLLWALEWVLLGAAVAGLALFRRHEGRQRRVLILIPGLAAVAVGVFLMVNAGPRPSATVQALDNKELASAEARWNPFLPDGESLTAGSKVYEDHCMICHGLTGHGDGSRSAGTDAVDIIEHVPLHTDLEYFEIVTSHDNRGDLLYSPAPISDEDVWHLVNYLHVFETDQRLAETYFSRARTEAEQGAYDRALLQLDQAVELSPRFVQALQGRSITAMDQGNLAQAIDDLSQVVMLDPAYGDGYYYRAEAYRLGRQWLAAIDDYTQAIELNLGRAGAFYGRGLAYAEVGRVDEAVSDLQVYLETLPENEERRAVAARVESLRQAAPGKTLLQLADLPAGFTLYPTASLGLVPGSALAGGMTIGSGFAFTGPSQRELVWGFTTEPMDAEQQAAFDARLLPEDLVTFIASGLQAESVRAVSTLSAAAELADAGVGITAVFTVPGSDGLVQGVAFRRGSVGAMIFVMAPPDEAPQASAVALARLLADSIVP